MRVIVAQYEVVRGDPGANLATIGELARGAADAGASVLMLPEMATTGFDWKRNRELLPEADRFLDRLSATAAGSSIALCGSFLERTESGSPANCLVFFGPDGSVSLRYRKVHLFTLFREERHMEAGDRIVSGDTVLGPTGCSICYDVRFPELFRHCMLAGAVVQLLPSAFPHPRLEQWRSLIRARAIENQCFFIAVNQCGPEAHGGRAGEVRYFGHSMVVDPEGEVVFEAGETPGAFPVDLDPEKVARVRGHITALEDRRPELY